MQDDRRQLGGHQAKCKSGIKKVVQGITMVQAKETRTIMPRERIEQRIYFLRGEKVMLSADLANLYQVAPKALVEAVKRNWDRFPGDFMFQLTRVEFQNLKSQIVTSSWGSPRRTHNQEYQQTSPTLAEIKI